ncbi:hypothetical protein JMUB7515_28130 [Staphylococcus aureus]
MKQYGEKFIDEFSKAELEKLAKQGQLIDVRTEEEYALGHINGCLLYTSDAADDMQCVDLGGRRIIKKKIFFKQKTAY